MNDTFSDGIKIFKASKTITIIGAAIRNSQDSEIELIVSQYERREFPTVFLSIVFCFQLRRFWRQLLNDDTYYFTARGLCTIDRRILTSVGRFSSYIIHSKI